MNIAKIAEKFVQDHPYIRLSLKKGLINYSSLARMIAGEADIDEKKNFDALLIACRRYNDKIKKEDNEKDIMELLSNSKLEVKNKIVVFVLEKNTPGQNIELIEKKIRQSGETFRLIEGQSAITIIVPEEFSKEISRTFKTYIIKESYSLVEVTLKTSKEIEVIPGVISFMFAKFADNSINIIETMSCWTDTIFIIEEKDLSKVMELLRF